MAARAPVPEPDLSVIVLTRNEEANVADALESLLAQEGVSLEAIVVDSASTDATLARAGAYEARDPRVRIVASPRDIPIGEARNLGLAHARGRHVAQMSADATASPGWAAALVESLREADVVYGRQEHAPPSLTPGAVVRGLRYHHFESDGRAPPETFASNVNAGMRREVVQRLRYVDDGPASALDDVLFTREARSLGMRIVYEPRMLVRHKDATTLRGELRKNRREGYGWGMLSPQLGLHRAALAWGATLSLALVALAVRPAWWLAAPVAALVYAPTLRRVARAGRRYLRRAPLALAAATLVSPAFDLAFVYHYVLGLLHRRGDLTGLVSPPGGHST